MAPRNSQTPVKYTMASGLGTHGGVMRTRSSFVRVKCALAVMNNMKAMP